jgi:hypothetical protein
MQSIFLVLLGLASAALPLAAQGRRVQDPLNFAAAYDK